MARVTGTMVGRSGSCFYNNFRGESRVISLAYKRLSKHPPPQDKQTNNKESKTKERESLRKKVLRPMGVKPDNTELIYF